MNTNKVLYAEDEFTNRKLVEIKLKNLGIVCDLAQNGLKAVEMFEQNSYRLVILDQYMPGLNGTEVAAKIREIDSNIPLIAITSDEREMEKLNDAGFNHIFIKPLKGSNFIRTVTGYINS